MEKTIVAAKPTVRAWREAPQMPPYRSAKAAQILIKPAITSHAYELVPVPHEADQQLTTDPADEKTEAIVNRRSEKAGIHKFSPQIIAKLSVI
ncbi:MAG: hypothetical protein WCA21_03375 [Terracidiphilus sp.]